jgi:hypothetical protein
MSSQSTVERSKMEIQNSPFDIVLVTTSSSIYFKTSLENR